MKVNHKLIIAAVSLIFFLSSMSLQAKTCISGDCVNGNGVVDYGGMKYEGEFKNGKKDGRGTFSWSNGSKFSGTWKEDNRVEGVEDLFNGFRYEGQYSNNLRNGKGTFTWIDGSIYEGEWQNDNMNGRGVKIWLDGKKYDGEWKNGLAHGKGTFTWPGGEKYEGDWQVDLFHGKGSYFWPNGKSYTGEFWKGNRHGQGVMKYDKNQSYDGGWCMNGRDGYGTYIWEDGQKYVGGFQDDKFYGLGTIYYPNGTIKSHGRWFKGSFTEVSNEPEKVISKKNEYNPEDYSEISIRLSELKEWKMPYADGEGKYYYLIAQEKCDSGLELEQWYQDRGFISGTEFKASFCGKKMPSGYQVFVKPVMFVWGKARSAAEIAEMKKRKDQSTTKDNSNKRSNLTSDCMDNCWRNCGGYITESAQSDCIKSCKSSCPKN